MNDRLATAIGVMITVAWAVSFVLDAALPRYEPPQTVHALMLIVAGAAFGKNIIKRSET